jgi:hypothetical protein
MYLAGTLELLCQNYSFRCSGSRGETVGGSVMPGACQSRLGGCDRIAAGRARRTAQSAASGVQTAQQASPLRGASKNAEASLRLL